MAQSTRFPLLEDLELRSATEDKDGVVSNVFYDKEEEALYAIKRPGLTSYLTGSGQGLGIYGLFFFYGQLLLLDTFNVKDWSYIMGHISDNGVSWGPGIISDSGGYIEDYSAFIIGSGSNTALVANPSHTGYIKAKLLFELGTPAPGDEGLASRIGFGWEGSIAGNGITYMFVLSVEDNGDSTVNMFIGDTPILVDSVSFVSTATGPHIDLGIYYPVEMDISTQVINLYITDPVTGIRTNYLTYTPTVDLTGFKPVIAGLGPSPRSQRFSYFEVGNLKVTGP